MKKTDFKEATKDLKLGDRVHVEIMGFPFEDYNREGILRLISKDSFALRLDEYPGFFTHSYRRVISIKKVSK